MAPKGRHVRRRNLGAATRSQLGTQRVPGRKLGSSPYMSNRVTRLAKTLPKTLYWQTPPEVENLSLRPDPAQAKGMRK